MGISYNKTFAKLATKIRKPDGLSIVTLENKKSEIYSMPACKVWGVGKRIAFRLEAMGINTIGDLAESSDFSMKKEFGVNGIIFRKLARGEDTSEITLKTKPEKSLTHHHTMSKPIYKSCDIKKELRRIVEYICRKLRSKNLLTGHIHLSLRFENLRYDSGDLKLTGYTNADREIFNSALLVFEKLHNPSVKLRARQLGLGVSDLHTDDKSINLNLFRNEHSLPYYALDKIKSKYEEKIFRVGLDS